MTRLTISRTLALLVWTAVLLVPGAARAQDLPVAEGPTSDPPAHIAFVDGAAVLERDGRADPAPTNMPLMTGDRVRTQTGRVEVLFSDGSVLHLDSNTTVDFQSDELIRLLAGRVRLAIPGPARRVSYRIDAPPASAEITQPGDYRVGILQGERGQEVELAVLRGAAALANGNGRTPLGAGERAFSREDAAPSSIHVFNSAAWDDFDRWSEGRRDQRLAISNQYLPEEVRPYASSFDRYGDWRHDTSYGYVWYPTVPVDWRPYYNGRWATLPRYGWTWIGADPWGWPTHHYGRWGVSAGAWFWIPGRHWAPSWVSWAYAPGYVSWCPLGWNNRPVVQIVNVHARGRHDPWRAWTVAPRRHFTGGDVHVRGVAVGMVDARARSSFVAQNTAPEFPRRAVPGSTVPIRSAGTAAPRRGSVPVYTNLEPGASRVGSAGSRIMVGRPAGSNLPAERPRPESRRPPADSSGVSTGVPSRTAPTDIRSLAPPTDGSAPGDRAMPRRSPSPVERSTYGQPVGSGVERRVPITPTGAARPVPRRVEDSPVYRPETGRPPAPEEPRRPGESRTAPRGGPEGAAPAPPVYRPSPGIERRSPEPSRPSGPPAEPARTAPPGGAVRSAPPSGPSGGEARPRSGGEPSTGTAMPRRGRGV